MKDGRHKEDWKEGMIDGRTDGKEEGRKDGRHEGATDGKKELTEGTIRRENQGPSRKGERQQDLARDGTRD